MWVTNNGIETRRDGPVPGDVLIVVARSRIAVAQQGHQVSLGGSGSSGEGPAGEVEMVEG